MVDLCFLSSVLRQTIDTLSKGYKHRTCLAQALIHDPEVLVIDEPTDGLDPNQKHEVRNLIRELGRSKAVVFSTHILEEVDAACTRAIIIDRGRIVATGPGTPLSEPASLDEEPWRLTGRETRYVPMQAQLGDYALFFRKAAVEITFEGKQYLVVPQAAILVLVRRGDPLLDEL